jgi:hypothetical protein
MSLVMGDELGYEFEPFATPGNEGYDALVINVIRVPTERHFDPDRVDVPIYTADNSVRHLIIAHPWHGKLSHRVALGHVVIRDRKNKVVEAFTCGGDLQIDVYPERTRCRITSPAPIFELVSQMGESPENYDAILAAELETLLARRRARWGLNDFGYQQRLAETDPLLLYAAGLYAVEEHLLAMPSRSRGLRYQRLLATVHRAQRASVLKEVPAESIPAFNVII